MQIGFKSTRQTVIKVLYDNVFTLVLNITSKKWEIFSSKKKLNPSKKREIKSQTPWAQQRERSNEGRSYFGWKHIFYLYFIFYNFFSARRLRSKKPQKEEDSDQKFFFRTGDHSTKPALSSGQVSFGTTILQLLKYIRE